MVFIPRILVFWCILIVPAEGLFCFGSRKNSTCISLRDRIRELFFTTVCYAKLGCFYTGPPFYHRVHRPITVPPQSPDIILPLYLLYTRRNRNRFIHLRDGDTKTLRESTFNPRAPVRIIVHGYLDTVGLTHWSLRMRDSILDQGDDNVILYDWSGGNGVSYVYSVANTRTAGALLANFIYFLCRKTGAYPQQFHILGHSLGAQIGGYAGQRIRNIGRITGFDPAGPLFNYMPPEVNLDPSDALFVDNIHTDQGEAILDGLGTSTDIGHLDFWPWNGKAPTAECAIRLVRALIQDPPTELAGNSFACRHLASTEYFIYSFNQSNCLFIGVKCRTWEQFTDGQCDCGEFGERCKIMGFYAEPPTPEDKIEDLRYYLKTSLDRPYCVHQYVIKIHVQNFHVTQKEQYEDYTADLVIIGHDNELQSQVNLNIKLRHHHQTLRFFITNEKPLGHVYLAKIKLKHHDSKSDVSAGQFHAFNWTKLSVDEIEVIYLYPSPRTHNAFRLCSRLDCSQEACKNKAVFKEDFCDL